MSFIKTVKKAGTSIQLYKLNGELLSKQAIGTTLFSNGINICFLDLETTGLNIEQDKIIEIALKVVKIDKSDGSIISFEEIYESFQDPGIVIEEKIIKITGINNEMVAGKEIDWNKVNDIVQSVDIIVAHNARFDRSFMDRYLPLSKDKIWACSVYDIDWINRGFVKGSLELLSIWHGFYYDSHRALNDVDAVIHLLSHPSYNDNKPIVELIKNSQIPYYELIALNSPYESKDILRSHNFRWNGNKKYWWKRVNKDEINDERNWLTDNVYNGYFMGIVEEILIHDKYKN
tara:strand:- start:165 stop:1031 length:867 start_codon:yes stop_codon:yes gene_type:complete